MSDRPRPSDPRLVGIYLNDHLAGAVAGSRRLRRTAEVLRSTPVGPGLARVASEVEQEREELAAVVAHLDVTQAWPKQALAWVGERVARLKADRSRMRSSPITTLLEVELLRSAVMGKRGVWQALVDLAGDLALDESRMVELVEQTERQLQTLDEVHAYVRIRAMRLVR
ncbi:hypothetical protein [Cellulomonas bogoriensis]|nr:hypothetical protein [Cellulomonas bogoriensis]